MPSKKIDDINHCANIYESESELMDSIVSILRRSYSSNWKCIIIVPNTKQSTVLSAIRNSNIDGDTGRKMGDVCVHSPQEIYINSEDFDINQAIDNLKNEYQQTIQEGYEGLCITADVPWLIDDGVDLDKWIEYEQRVDAVFPERELIGLCLFDRDLFPAEFLSEVVEAHPKITDGTTDIRNPHYIPRFVPFETNTTEERLDHQLEILESHQSRAHRLSNHRDFLHSLSPTIQTIGQLESHSVIQDALGNVIQTIDVPIVGAFIYDSETKAFEPQIKAPDHPHITGEVLTPELSDQIWNTFTDAERTTFTQRIISSDPSVHQQRQIHGTMLPLGHYGVFFAAKTYRWEPSSRTIDLLETSAGIIRATLEQQRHQQEIQRKQNKIEAQNKQLKGVERINSIFRRLNTLLVEASTQDELKSIVCTELQRIDEVKYVAFAELHRATESLKYSHIAGESDNYFHNVEQNSERTGAEITKEVARTGVPQTTQRLQKDTPLTHWKRKALRRGVQSVVSQPVVYDGEPYGVVSIYLTRPNIITDDHISALRQISGLVARLLNDMERRGDVIDDSVTEFQFKLPTDTDPLVQFVSEYNCQLRLKDITQGESGRIQAIVSMSLPVETATQMKQRAGIDQVHLLSESTTEYIYKLILNQNCLLVKLVDHTVIPKELVVEDQSTHLTFDIPEQKQTRSFLDFFETLSPGSVLVKKTQKNQRSTVDPDLQSLLEVSLSSRQFETLRTAYFGGYFEWPRQSTAREIGEALDITHPTVSRHLRTAYQVIFRRVFEDEEP